MQLAPLHFTKIEGTAVSVNVASADEAKAAIKELRQRKKELKFLRTGLAKLKKAARPKRPRKAKVAKSGFDMFVDDMQWGLSTLLRPGQQSGATPKQPTLAEIEREMRELDQVIHNIDGCILQLEGRLLRHK